jgi:CRP/FNR family cyclic AMP-dependent transcriptional regulator
MFLGSSEFARIGEAAISVLGRAAMRRRFAANEFIYLPEDEAKHLYVVVSGYVRLSYLMEDGSSVLHAVLPSGETFGELGVFENGTYCDMATAIGPVVTASIPTSAFRSLGRQYPEIADALGRVVARRYRSYVMLTRDLSLKTLPARLAQAVLRLADGLGTRTQFRGRDVSFLGAVVTQSDLGLMARGSRGNVNRALKAWERAGSIAMHERCIMILDREWLESLSIKEGL